MKNLSKTKIWLITLATPILIYFIWGYFGFAGAWIPGKYDKKETEYRIFWSYGVESYNKGACAIMIFTPFKRCGMIDTTGKVIIPFKYSYLSDPHFANHNLISAEDLNGKLGAINKRNEIVIPFEYDKLKRRNGKTRDNYIYFSLGEFAWSKDGKRALFDTLGKQILPPEYSKFRFIYTAYSNYENRWVNARTPYFIADKGNHCYFVLENGKKIKYDFISTESFVINSKRNELWVEGVPTKNLDENLWEITDYHYTYTDSGKKVSINKMKDLSVYQGLYDSLGKEILPLEYDKIERYQDRNDLDWDDENLICYRVKKNEKWGVYNTHLKKWILPLQFEDITIFNEEFPLIKARKNQTENYSYFDLNGNLILSKKIEVYNQRKNYLFFYKNGIRYKLEYNKDKLKFTWHRL